MEALYSPFSQTLTLTPRFSSSSLSSTSSSSSSSICLCISRIQSIRSEFLGFSPKLRLKTSRKYKRLRFHTNYAPVASLNSLPIVAVVVAVTVSAAVVVFSNYYYSKKKNDNDSVEVPFPSIPECNQMGEDTRKVGFYSPVNAANLQVESFKDINYSSLEIGESTAKANGGRVDLSWNGFSSTPEGLAIVEHAEVSNSDFHELGVVASALLEKIEGEGPSLPPASSQLNHIESFKQEDCSLPEVVETIPLDEGGANLSGQDISATPSDKPHAERADFLHSNFHDLGAIASALSEKSAEIGLSLPEPSPASVDMEALKKNNHSLPKVRETTPMNDEGRVNVSCQDPSSTAQDPSNFTKSKFPDSNFQDLGAIASAVSGKSNEKGLCLSQDPPELDALQSHYSHIPFSEESNSGNCVEGSNSSVLSHAHVDVEMDAVSALVDNELTGESSHEEQSHDCDQNEVQVSGYHQSKRSGRDELYLFYESTTGSDNLELLQGINGSSTEGFRWEKNSFPVTAKSSSPKMLQEDYYQASGFGGHGTVASHAGGSFHEGKDKRKVRRNLRSDTRGPSLQHDHQQVSDLPDAYAPQVDRKHSIPRQMSSYNHLLKSGRLTKCVELLEDMDSKDILDMDKIYHSKFFDFCRRQKAVKEAFRFAKLIRNPTLSTFNMLMSVCSAAQDSEGAFEVWHLVQKAGYRPDCRLYTTLISTCAKSGKVDTMFEVFHEMVNAGVEPNIHTYGALIDGCARAGQVAKAFGVYGILRSKNLKPDRVIFNALIRACGQSGAVERAFDVLAEMRSEVQPIDPDHITVGALIRACTSAGQVDRSKEVYDMMDQFNIKGTPELYTIAANSCSLTGDWNFACKIYADMKTKGVIPDEMFFSALVDVAGHAGNIDAAFEVLQDARAEGMNPGIITYSSLMGACSNTQNWEKALELFEHIKAKGLNPTVSTVNALITALCDADQMQKALEILAQMQKLHLRPNDVTYSILIAASEKNDDLDVGLTLYSQAKADGVSLSQIMCKCLIKMCLRRFEKASTIGEPVLSLKSGRPQIDNKWASLALLIYREMIGAGLIPSAEMLSQVLGCFQLPKDVSLKKTLTETLGINAESSRSRKLFPLIDGFAEYDPRAFSLFEEAASLGIVPGASFKESPILIDATGLNVHILEVYILTVLKALKHRLAAGAKVPNIAITLPKETEDISCSKGEKTINLSARLGQAVGALLRRIRLPYQGSESSGKIRISGLAVKRWLQPKLVPSFTGSNVQMGSSQLRLAKGITNQQRTIRTGNLSLD